MTAKGGEKKKKINSKYIHHTVAWQITTRTIKSAQQQQKKKKKKKELKINFVTRYFPYTLFATPERHKNDKKNKTKKKRTKKTKQKNQ